jgi:hypothetical protein
VLTELDLEMFETEAWFLFWAKVFKCFFDFAWLLSALFSMLLKKNLWLHQRHLQRPLTKIWLELGILPIYTKISRFATTFSVIVFLRDMFCFTACLSELKYHMNLAKPQQSLEEQNFTKLYKHVLLQHMHNKFQPVSYL